MSKTLAPIFAPSDFAQRRADFLKEVTRDGHKTVAVFGFGSALGAGTQSHPALRYLTGWDSREATSLLVFDQSKTVLLISSPFMVELAKTTCTDLDIMAVPPAKWGAIVRSRFAGSDSLATIGFDEMPSGIRTSFAADIGPDLHECDNTLSRQRLQKSDKERVALQRGAAICDTLFASLADHLQANRPIWQTQLHLETQARLAGADYCKTWLTVRPQADRPRYWKDDALNCPAKGDQVLIGIALTYEGYWAHGLRTGHIGHPTQEQKRLWHIARDALIAGQNTLIAGQSLSFVDAAITDVLDQAGKATRFRNGHGLGTAYEEPLATDDFLQPWGGGAFAVHPTQPLIISESAVFELHPNLFAENVGGAALGEMYIVGKSAPKSLLNFPLDIFQITLRSA
jgi:Xaa-Pro aminopeptidase